MSYNATDLVLFQPLAGPEGRDGTSYFELHPKEISDPRACWLSGSLFVRDAAFDFFAECFHSASDSFDYFSFQRFDAVEINRLVQDLTVFIDRVAGAPTREDLFSRYSSIFTQEIWENVETQDLAPAVRECGEKLRSFIQLNTRQSQCLWILGM